MSESMRKIIEHYRNHFIVMEVTGRRRRKRGKLEVELDWGYRKEMVILYFFNEKEKSSATHTLRGEIDNNIKLNKLTLMDAIDAIEEERA